MRIADGYAHRRTRISQKWLARDNKGRLYLRVRRVEDTTPFYGYLTDVLVRDLDGTWRQRADSGLFATRLGATPSGETFTYSRSTFHVLTEREADLPAIVVVTPPAGGWLWQNGNLSPTEQANVRHNFGLPSGAPLPQADAP